MASRVADLEQQITDAIEALDEVDSVESTRGDLASAVVSALAILRGEDVEEGEDDSGDDDE
jgi:hypothetical protein